MDFANEPYVRLYKRDTPAWMYLGWEARAVFPLLLRKVDRSGVLDFPTGLDPCRVVAKVLDMPLEHVERGLQDLDAAGVIEIHPGVIVIPRFVEAQSTPASPAERQRRCRERARTHRKRDHELAELGEIDEQTGHEPCHSVTPRHARVIPATSGPPQGNAANKPVTPRHAVSPLTEQIRSGSRSSNVLSLPAAPEVDHPGKNLRSSVEPPSHAPTAALAVKPLKNFEPAAVAVVVAASKTEEPDRSSLSITWPCPPRRSDEPLTFVHGWLADFRYRWAALVVELECDLKRKLRPPLPWAGAEKMLGVQAAISEYGAEQVADVLLFELGRWAHTQPDDPSYAQVTAFLSRMFVGDGFAAARGRWANFEARWELATKTVGAN